MPAEFDRLRLAIKRQLKKDNPSLSDDELDSRSYAIATAQWKRNHGGQAPSRESISDEKKYDEEGRIIVAENVKFYIEGGISTITE